jgi:cellulose biosynthesis protein BcsQ
VIYTFYSFKGGVGRSMALANIAELFYARGLKVLMVDFDLEAPGLERYFGVPLSKNTPEQARASRGMIDLLFSYKEMRSLSPLSPPDTHVEGVTEDFISMEPLEEFVVTIYEDSTNSRFLKLLPAGDRGSGFSAYAERVLGFDWAKFYSESDGERFFEWFRKQTEAMADVILIDSRTGVTEMGGVCTHQIADAVISFVATNEQNLEGTLMMATSLSRPALIKERGGRPLDLVFVPSRVEPFAPTKLDQFARRFDETLTKYFTNQLTFEKGPFIDLRIPYTPEYAYVEDVAVREKDSASKADLIGAFKNLASYLAKLAPAGSRLLETYFPSTSTTQVIKRAEQLIEQMSPDERTGVREVLSRVVIMAPDGDFSASKAKLDAVTELAPVVAKLTEISVVKPVIDSQGTRITLADDQLIHDWRTFNSWLREDAAFLTWRQQIDAAATVWEGANRDEGWLLSGALLTQALQMDRDHPLRLNQSERVFIGISKSTGEKKEAGATKAQEATSVFRRVAASAEMPSSAEVQSPAPQHSWSRWMLAGVAAILVVGAVLIGPRIYSTASPLEAALEKGAANGQWLVTASGRLSGSMVLDLKPDHTYQIQEPSGAFDSLGVTGAWGIKPKARIALSPAGGSFGATIQITERTANPSGSVLAGQDDSGASYVFARPARKTPPAKISWCYQEKATARTAMLARNSPTAAKLIKGYGAYCHSSKQSCEDARPKSGTATECGPVSDPTIQTWGATPASGGLSGSSYLLNLERPLQVPFPQFTK